LEGGTCFGVHINKGKRRIPIIWGQKLHGVVASMYSLHGKQDAVHVLPMR
jgi:hypothetical protein